MFVRNVHRMASDDLHHHAMHEDVLTTMARLSTVCARESGIFEGKKTEGKS